MKDEIFKSWGNEKFSFNESVVSVFDDMILRSVPFYKARNELVCEFLSRILAKNSRILDLGCSTANTLLALFSLRKDFKLVGVDLSEAMIKQAKNKALAHGANIEFLVSDITKCELGLNDAVILNYTLQFIKPDLRVEFLAKIYASLKNGGVLILSEKLNCQSLNEVITAIYEDYKEAQGYSRLEIAKKREALSSVLIPLSENENKEFCLNAGFSDFECIFRWGNFATFVVSK